MDTGFRYSFGDLELELGDQVRIPLGGRRARGWVVEVEEGDDEGLKAVLAKSGELPVFGSRQLVTMRWASQHYVAPLSVILGKAAPPNLPRATDEHDAWHAVPEFQSPLPAVTAAAVAGRHVRPHYLLSPVSTVEAIAGLAGPVLTAGRSVVIIYPTAAEAESAAGALRGPFEERVLLATGSMHDRDVTRTWGTSAGVAGTLLVATPRALLWPVAGLGLGIVVEEGRRGHKERQTPTLHSREVMRRRSTVERFPLVFIGRVPTTELVAAGTPTVKAPGRAWPLVEVVDRRLDPSIGLFTEHVKAAIQGAVKRNEPVFVFTHRHGYAPAFLCVSCRSIRVCENCGSRLDRDGTCARCGHHQLACSSCEGRKFVPLGAGTGRVTAELGRFVDRTAVGPAGSGRAVEVGTVRDLVRSTTVDMAVAVDADGLFMGSNYRAAEDALRTLARLAGLVGRGRGKRAAIQTTRPDHPVIQALRRGDPSEFLDSEVDERAAYKLPPSGEVIVVEVTKAPDWVDAVMAELGNQRGTVLGPAERGDSKRWLVQGADLGSVRERLRELVHRLRDAQASVRVDVDPIEL